MNVKVYTDLELRDTLDELSKQNVQYIMTKKIVDMYLENIHEHIRNSYQSITVEKLNHDSIFSYYYTWISDSDDIFDSHMQILNKIYNM